MEDAPKPLTSSYLCHYGTVHVLPPLRVTSHATSCEPERYKNKDSTSILKITQSRCSVGRMHFADFSRMCFDMLIRETCSRQMNVPKEFFLQPPRPLENK